jgi:RNA ligase (TIGR02306 family)
MRKLATVREIKDVLPIEGADKICLYKIDGWQVVDQKGRYRIGDLVVYFEIDSYLPVAPEFEFLRKSSYKRLLDGTEGFRLKSIRLRGSVSQGLIVPLPDDHEFMYRIGEDCSEYFGVTKYEPSIPAELTGQMEGSFPSFIPKTDEDRVQNLKESDFIGKTACVTEKLEGTSATYFVKDGVFGACSRNWQLRHNPDNAYFKAADEIGLENKMKNSGYANLSLQGELIGPGIQGNIYKLNKPTIRFFTAYDIDNSRRLNPEEFFTLMCKLGLETVPLITMDACLTGTDELLEFADFKSMLNPDTWREGIVIRLVDGSLSFKAISNKYLLKQKD